MTVSLRRRAGFSAEVLFFLATVFIFALFLRNSSLAAEYVLSGMDLCATKIVPSIFPFMVISELLVSSRMLEGIGRRISGPMRLLSVSGEGAVALLLGALSGFPVGARTSVRLFDEGRISASECERLLTVSNNPSAAFVLVFVGESLYSSRSLGLILWGVTVVCSLLSGMLVSRLFINAGENSNKSPVVQRKRRSAARLFTEAVTSSALSTLHVCGYVIFFSAFTGVLGNVLSSLGVKRAVGAVMYSFVEISTGVCEAAKLGGDVGLPLCAFALGWSGISVHCQIASVTAGRGLDLTPYLLSKALSGVLCAAVVTLLRAAVKT